MRRTRISLLVGLLSAIPLFSSVNAAQEHDIVVVANIDNKSVQLEKVEIRNLFMGNGSDLFLEPVSLPPETLARAIFNTKIIGLTEARIQSYWSQMRFSGRSRPPKEFDNVEALIEYVAKHKDTVAFVPANAEIPSHLTVVYQTNGKNNGSRVLDSQEQKAIVSLNERS